MSKNQLKQQLAVATRESIADLVIKNGKILDVFNREIIEEDVAIKDGKFVGIGDYDGKEIIDAKGSFVCPTFIDGHVHIESSMVTPNELGKVLLPHGVSTIIADPHEIANVSGSDGIQYILDASEKSPLNIYIMLPSCVPATEFEHSGATLTAEDLAPFYDHPLVLGLAEVMDFPAVLTGKDQMLDKLLSASKYEKLIDGHAAGLDKYGLNGYMTAGIRTDHEAISVKEAKERLQRGMHLMIREGSVAKDLVNLLPVVTEKNASRCLFVTDDKHLDDLLEEGNIDHNVRLAITNGMDPLLAYCMASFHSAQYFGLQTKGAIAPGYDADFMLVSNIEEVTIKQVFTNGAIVAQDGKLVIETEDSYIVPPVNLTKSVNLPELKAENFQIKLDSAKANIIDIIPNSLVTKHMIEEVDIENGIFIPSVEKDQLKLTVIERHHQTGHIGLGIVKGLKLQAGAIASTVAHDSHNLIVCSTNDQDLLTAVEVIKQMQGGTVVVKDGQVLSKLELSISGLISDKPYEEVNKELKHLNAALAKIGFQETFNPFLTLSFLALPVIPELKLTDLGLFDVKAFKHIDISAI
ncbi:adenine deaminase [Bacillus sp. FJAT-45350]|uniref:adenine deaminase n=1 Tax=Bacillus sp. FJAT-45350 TaxID=2011014 RepID=UPI00211CF9FF|nr:adenine deaminase [Bacillus sp. FJAT-45350]